MKAAKSHLEAKMNGLKTNKSLIHIGIEVSTDEELIRKLCENVLEQGYIEPLFVEKIIEREREFPTRLPTVIPIAIPHVHDKCLKSFFSMAVCEKPVHFHSIDGSEEGVNVNLVFMSGITDPPQQTKVLMKFCEVLTDENTLTKMMGIKSVNEMQELLMGILEEYVV